MVLLQPNHRSARHGADAQGRAGSGPCGSWPDLLLVGWADGAFTALHPSNGTLHWQANSNVSGWGITGASLIEGDDAVIPTETG